MLQFKLDWNYLIKVVKAIKPCLTYVKQAELQKIIFCFQEEGLQLRAGDGHILCAYPVANFEYTGSREDFSVLYSDLVHMVGKYTGLKYTQPTSVCFQLSEHHVTVQVEEEVTKKGEEEGIEAPEPSSYTLYREGVLSSLLAPLTAKEEKEVEVEVFSEVARYLQPIKGLGIRAQAEGALVYVYGGSYGYTIPNRLCELGLESVSISEAFLVLGQMLLEERITTCNYRVTSLAQGVIFYVTTPLATYQVKVPNKGFVPLKMFEPEEGEVSISFKKPLLIERLKRLQKGERLRIEIKEEVTVFDLDALTVVPIRHNKETGYCVGALSMHPQHLQYMLMKHIQEEELTLFLSKSKLGADKLTVRVAGETWSAKCADIQGRIKNKKKG